MVITFTIDLQGNITTDVEGGDGVNCLKATQPYEAALGDPNPKRDMKPEARSQAIATNQTHRIQQ
jgi:hypothetical protein